MPEYVSKAGGVDIVHVLTVEDLLSGYITASGTISTGSFLISASFINPFATFSRGDGTRLYVNLISLVPTNASTASFVTGANVYGPFGSNSVISASHVPAFGAGASPPEFGVQFNSGGFFAGNSTFLFRYDYLSLMQGEGPQATGLYSHAQGYFTTASGRSSHAEGSLTQAVGVGAHAEGATTKANGNDSHAEGSHSLSMGASSHAEGFAVSSSGLYSHAEGERTLTIGASSHAEGYQTKTAVPALLSANPSAEEGVIWFNAYGNITSSFTAGLQIVVDTRDGPLSGALPVPRIMTVLSSSFSGGVTKVHLEQNGYYVFQDARVHLVNLDSSADFTFSGSHPNFIAITGSKSHTEGYRTITLGTYSHAEGSGSKAVGPFSHVEGKSTITTGRGTHAEGESTKAEGKFSHTEGYRTQAGTFKAWPGYVINDELFFEFDSNNPDLAAVVASLQNQFPTGSRVIVDDRFGDNLIGIRTFVVLANTGGTLTLDQNIGTSTFGAFVGNLDKPIRDWIGDLNRVGSFGLEDEGWLSVGEYSHAEGNQTEAVWGYSHAEGSDTRAGGLGSHAEGSGSIAYGNFSHVEGWQTKAVGPYQHVVGQFNISSSAQSAFIIGNGTAESSRRNLVFASGSLFQITGSLIVTAGITGSLFGTASWALTASFVTASNVWGPHGSNSIISSSHANTASFIDGGTF